MTRKPPATIKSFFEPASVAVAGVSPNPEKLASIIFANLIRNAKAGVLKASVYPVNPAHPLIGEERCYPSIGSLPEVPELLIIAIPASSSLQLVDDAAEVGVKAVIMIPGGFSEVGRADLTQRVLAKARASGLRILGPNTIGLVDTVSGVDSSFLKSTKVLPTGKEIVSHPKPLKGGVVIITQSGHLGETISEELAARGIGLRALVGTGNQLDVSVEEILGYFAADPGTTMVALYFEGLADGRRFMREASAAAKRKPVVVFKAGKTEVGARAALTHTASMVGDHASYRAAFRQSGLVEAKSIQELIDLCVSFSTLPRIQGNRLAIVTNAGGVGAIAADESMRCGLETSPPTTSSINRMKKAFRNSSFISNASLGNPIDLTASASTQEFASVVEFILGLKEYDMALLMPTHQTPTIDPDVAIRLSEVVSRTEKPVAVCVMGSSDLSTAISSDFATHNIPAFPTPERAVCALAAAVDYSKLKRRSPAPPAPFQKEKDRFGRLSRLRGRLRAKEADALLSFYGISQPRSVIIRTERDLLAADRVGYPVACKLLSARLLHKTDVGGVLLGVKDRAGVADALVDLTRVARERRLKFEGMLVQPMIQGEAEVILGGTRDPTFGPTLLFGAGGKYTELLKDYSLAVAPVNKPDAKQLILDTRLAPLLLGYRSEPKVNIDRLAEAVSRFSHIMPENPSISELEINPLVVLGSRMVALDVKVLLRS